MPVTHITSESITIDGRYMRQRCGWCGHILLEYDLARVAVPAGPETGDWTPATWPAGALVAVDGNASWTVDTDRLPDDACALNPLTLIGLSR